nr:MAG TPA: hypothetical protein [Caudoviricetes sp.]
MRRKTFVSARMPLIHMQNLLVRNNNFIRLYLIRYNLIQFLIQPAYKIHVRVPAILFRCIQYTIPASIPQCSLYTSRPRLAVYTALAGVPHPKPCTCTREVSGRKAAGNGHEKTTVLLHRGLAFYNLKIPSRVKIVLSSIINNTVPTALNGKYAVDFAVCQFKRHRFPNITNLVNLHRTTTPLL